MRKIFTFLLICLSGAVVAQTLSIVSHTDTIYYDADVSGTEVVGYTVIKNNSTDDNFYKAKISGNPAPLCATNWFCWDFCYTPGKLESDGNVKIDAGATNNSMSGHIFSTGNGVEDGCKMTCTIYNEFDRSDSITFDYIFYATKSFSVEDNAPSVKAVYPNPARDMVFVDLNNTESGTFKIINVIGQEVKSQNIFNSNKLSIDVSDLESGVYFYSLEVKGKSIETKRLIVSR